MAQSALVKRDVGAPLIPSVSCPNCGSEFDIPRPSDLRCFDGVRHPQQKAFLSAYVRNGGRVSTACKEVGIDRSLPYYWLKNNTEFAEAFEIAKELSILELESEAIRRGFEGVDKPVTYHGEITDTYKEFSDTLLIFTLKGLRPEKYRERFEHTGANGGPIDVNVGLDFGRLDVRMRQAALLIAEGKADSSDYVMLTKDEYRRLTGSSDSDSHTNRGSGPVIDVTPRAQAQVETGTDTDNSYDQLSIGELPTREEW